MFQNIHTNTKQAALKKVKQENKGVTFAGVFSVRGFSNLKTGFTQFSLASYKAVLGLKNVLRGNFKVCQSHCVMCQNDFNTCQRNCVTCQRFVETPHLACVTLRLFCETTLLRCVTLQRFCKTISLDNNMTNLDINTSNLDSVICQDHFNVSNLDCETPILDFVTPSLSINTVQHFYKTCHGFVGLMQWFNNLCQKSINKLQVLINQRICRQGAGFFFSLLKIIQYQFEKRQNELATLLFQKQFVNKTGFSFQLKAYLISREKFRQFESFFPVDMYLFIHLKCNALDLFPNVVRK